jgi:hypothetical protein
MHANDDRADQESDRDSNSSAQEKLHRCLRRREYTRDRGHDGEAIGHQRGCVVEEPFAL